MLVLELLHDIIVCNKTMLVGTCLEWFSEDRIGITMIRNHNILIAALQAYREPTSIISVSVQFRNRLYANV